MVALNIKKQNTTAAKLDELTKDAELRPYLGMSKLGHSCERYLWYSFRWCYHREISARMKRLFKRGHREEPAMIYELEQIGIRVWGDQTEITMAHGHSKGHNDGICLGVIEAPATNHLFEAKTMSDKYFKQTKKDGVQKTKPVYYAQMQIYMHKLSLTRALFMAVNKNDDEYYLERVKYDEGFANDLERKAERIIISEEPPDKAFSPTWFECKFCDARNVCHKGLTPHVTCRSCRYCDILPEGKWSCQMYDDLLLHTEQQKMACDKYELLNCLEV